MIVRSGAKASSAYCDAPIRYLAEVSFIFGPTTMIARRPSLARDSLSRSGRWRLIWRKAAQAAACDGWEGFTCAGADHVLHEGDDTSGCDGSGRCHGLGGRR